MTEQLQPEALNAAFAGAFRQDYDTESGRDWRRAYTEHVRRVHAAKPREWMDPEFQKTLWDDPAISTIGPGQSVTVTGAYTDRQLAELLLDARDRPPTGTPADRGEALQALYGKILAYVHPRYTKRRPRARIVRLLAALFPGEMTCLMDARRTWQVQTLIGAAKVQADFIGQNPLIRARLQALLGEPTGFELHVDHSVFTWFLWDTYCRKADQGAVEVARNEREPSDLPSLSLLPATSQRRSPTCVRDNVGLLVAVVREAEQGITRPDLINVIQREAPQLSQSSAAIIISQAQGGLGLIHLSDGAYRPTERGAELLNAPDPATVLRAPLVGRFFGMGHLLMLLRKNPDGVAQQDLAKGVSATCPTWTSSRPGQELIQWAVATGLVQPSAAGGAPRLVLSEDGEDYAAALPADFEQRWHLLPDQSTSPPSILMEVDPLPPPSLNQGLEALKWQQLQSEFQSGPLSSKLILAEERLAELHAALHASDRKRFVLLAGLSGTGKTLLARAYAEAYCRAKQLDPLKHYHQVAVRPDWTDPTGLLGFINALVDPPSYQPTGTLALLSRAGKHPEKPFFLCLDEMNLARIEHYFAPFLSAMEGEGGWLELHGEQDTIDNVEPRIPWPRNLFIFGTVNMDESTHAFSDKVLDRAYAFEFWDVDLAEWENRKKKLGARQDVLERLAALLRQAYAVLQPARRHFGYRTADEALAFCEAGIDALSLTILLDAVVLSKVLPRVRGDDTGPLKTALEGMAALAADQQLVRTAKKISAMMSALDTQGQTGFWS